MRGEQEGRGGGPPVDEDSISLEGKLPPGEMEQGAMGDAGDQTQAEKGAVAQAERGGISVEHGKEGIDLGLAPKGEGLELAAGEALDRQNGVEAEGNGIIGRVRSEPAVEAGKMAQVSIDGNGGETLALEMIAQGGDIRGGQLPGHLGGEAGQALPGRVVDQDGVVRISMLEMGDPGFKEAIPFVEAVGGEGSSGGGGSGEVEAVKVEHAGVSGGEGLGGRAREDG
jgi:hypothetical protein